MPDRTRTTTDLPNRITVSIDLGMHRLCEVDVVNSNVYLGLTSGPSPVDEYGTVAPEKYDEFVADLEGLRESVVAFVERHAHNLST